MELCCHISSVSYRKKTVLRQIDFSLSSGEFVAVIGKNGTGKSTLISALSGQIPFLGEVTLDGALLSSLSLKERALRIALMPQLLRAPHITVEELVYCGRTPYTGISGPSAVDREAVKRAMEKADLVSLKDAYLDRISGGELRRAYFGMALAQDTPILLLDEATAFLDVDYEARLLHEVKTCAMEEKKTVIAVMHNPEYALMYADRILLLDGGTLRFFGAPDDLLRTDLLESVFHLKRFSAEDGEGNDRIFFSAALH